MKEQLELPITGRRKPRYKLKPYWRAAMIRVGAQTFEDAIIKTYRRTRSLRKTAKILGFSYVTIREKLVLMGVKRGSPGGNNNPLGVKRKKS